jgi:hypothetical protein
MELKPSEALVGTTSLGLAAVSYGVTEQATYAGVGVEFTLPLLGLAWVVAEVRGRQVEQAVDGDETDDGGTAA